MEKIMTENDILFTGIEDILFDEEQLDHLKILIKKLYNNTVTPKEFKTFILKQKANSLKRIFGLFPYYIKQIKINDSLRQYTEGSLNSDSTNELQEKNKFLEQVGIRVNYLVNKLSKKLQD